MKTDRRWYLFDVNPATPPAFEVAPGEEFTLEVRGAFADVEDVRTVPIVGELRIGTAPRPVMAARLIIPRAIIEAAAKQR